MRNRRVRRACAGAALMLIALPALAQDPWKDSYAAEAALDYQQAIESLAPVLEANPDHEFALMRRGWLNYLAGQYNESLRDYQRALELNEESLEARLGIMLPLLAQQRWRQAAAYGQEVLAVSPWNYYAHLRLLVAEEGQRQWGAMVSRAEALSKRYPSDAAALVYLARGLARQGRTKEAIAAYRRVLERAPYDEESLRYVAGER